MFDLPFYHPKHKAVCLHVVLNDVSFFCKAHCNSIQKCRNMFQMRNCIYKNPGGLREAFFATGTQFETIV